MDICFLSTLPLTRRAISSVFHSAFLGKPVHAPRKIAFRSFYYPQILRACASRSAVTPVAPADARLSNGAGGESHSGRVRVRSVHESGERYLGREICVKGWVRTLRDQKRFAFLNINDGSSVAGLQVVVEEDTDGGVWEVVRQLRTGSAVAVKGEVVPSLGKGQKFELKASDVRLVGQASDDYPLQKKRHTREFLRTIAHLRPRTNAIGAMARVRSALAVATHEFFASRGFIYLNSPIITSSDCEGAGEMFRVTTVIPTDAERDSIPVQSDNQKVVDFDQDFFGKPAFLTVSGQLSAEAYACALGDVYTFGPTFRAENSNTSRHLAEFWMIEPEMAFADLKDDMDNAESYVKYVTNSVLTRCSSDVEFFDRFVEQGLLEKLHNVSTKPFKRISYSEAIEILQAANKPNKKGKRRFEFDVFWGADLQSEHERYLAEEHFKRPVFVYDYPAAIKAFYMKANESDHGKTVQAMDLLVPGIGELIGGSAREDKLDVLEEKIASMGLNKEDYWWYLDLRRHGSVPHAGYGLGFERLVQFVTGLDNIRDVIPFPRYPRSAEF